MARPTTQAHLFHIRFLEAPEAPAGLVAMLQRLPGDLVAVGLPVQLQAVSCITVLVNQEDVPGSIQVCQLFRHLRSHRPFMVAPMVRSPA